MCGISGYLLDDIPPKIDLIFDNLSHRGPDDSGFYKEKIDDHFYGLYHRRLSIYDLTKNASQPIKSRDGNYIISFNGAIYNYKEIQEQISQREVYKYKGDTQVLIEAISEWGTLKTWEEISGMFAIAIIDKRNSCLKLVRDRVGQKPLFYVIDPVINNKIYKGIIFASEIKALTSIINYSLDQSFIQSYLRLGRLDSSTDTFYKEIKRLDPGHELTFKSSYGITNYKSYWQVAEKIDYLKENFSREELSEMTKKSIKEAISYQITGDRKLGIMLSSGVDSTVLACLMREHTKDEIYSFTYDFNNCRNSEAESSKVTSNMLGLKHIKSESLTTKYIKENLIKVVRHQDEPITSIRTVAQHYIHEIAASVDCRILIEGNGGDEIFGGYEHYKYARILDEISDSSVETSKLSKILENIDNKDLITGLRSILIPGLCAKDATEVRNLSALSDQVLNANLKSIQYRNQDSLLSKDFNFTMKAQINDFTSIFLPRSLRYVDRASMAAGNEARAPLLDNRVVEAGLAFSSKDSFHYQERDLLRSMGQKNILKKTGINKKTIVDPQRDWLYGELFNWANEILNESKEVLKEFYNFDILIQNILNEKIIWEQNREGNTGAFMQAINLSILLNKNL